MLLIHGNVALVSWPAVVEPELDVQFPQKSEALLEIRVPSPFVPVYISTVSEFPVRSFAYSSYLTAFTIVYGESQSSDRLLATTSCLIL